MSEYFPVRDVSQSLQQCRHKMIGKMLNISPAKNLMKDSVQQQVNLISKGINPESVSSRSSRELQLPTSFSKTRLLSEEHQERCS